MQLVPGNMLLAKASSVELSALLNKKDRLGTYASKTSRPNLVAVLSMIYKVSFSVIVSLRAMLTAVPPRMNMNP